MLGFKMKKSGLWNEAYRGFENQYADKNPTQNRIIADGLTMSLNTKKTKRNNNMALMCREDSADEIIYGNILQANCNYIIPDEDGVMLKVMREYLEACGYNIHVINLDNHQAGEYYNPVATLLSASENTEAGAIKFARALQHNKPKDVFMQKVCEQIMCMLMAYIQTLPAEKHNIQTVKELLTLADGLSPRIIDSWKFIDSCESEKARKAFTELQSIPNIPLLQAIVDLTVTLDVMNFESSDRPALSLMPFQFGKHALFIVHSSKEYHETTLGLMYMQILDVICSVSKSKKFPANATPVCAVVKHWVPELTHYMSQSSKLNVHFYIHGDISTLKYREPIEWQLMLDCCDTIIYDGMSNQEYMIPFINGTFLQHSKSKTANKMQQDHTFEIKNTLGDFLISKCIVMVRGVDPFLARQYRWESHPKAEAVAFYNV